LDERDRAMRRELVCIREAAAERQANPHRRALEGTNPAVHPTGSRPD
jgi:hypothetical protein